MANVFTAVLNCLADDIPHNSGAFRRVRVLLRDDCVVGRPAFPHSCSVCTTNVAERLIYAVQGAFASWARATAWRTAHPPWVPRWR